MSLRYALTVRQPFAAALVHGPKVVENRSKPPPASLPIGEWVAIHAGRELYDLDEEGGRWLKSVWPEVPADEDDPRMAMGAIVGAVQYLGWCSEPHVRAMFARSHGTWLGMPMDAARIPGCERLLEWFTGPIGIVRAPRTVILPTPIPCRGALGYWTIDGDARQQLDNLIKHV